MDKIVQDIINDEKKEWRNNPIKNIWRKDGSDFIADIGTMKKALVVCYYTNRKSRYGLSPRSYFPLTKEQMQADFNDYRDCIEFGERIIMEWVQSILVANKEVEKIKMINNA